MSFLTPFFLVGLTAIAVLVLIHLIQREKKRVVPGATRYGPAPTLAESILSRSSLKRREAVLISDFQKSGWGGSEDARFAEGMTLRTVSVASGDTANLAVPSVSFARSAFSG